MSRDTTNRPPQTLSAKSPRVWVAQGVWFENVFGGVSSFAHKHGWTLDASLRFTREPVRKPAVKPDGVIAFTLDTPGLEEAVRALRNEGVPVVDMEAYVDRYGAPRVIGDDFKVGHLAAEHLASTHPTKLYAVFHNPDTPVSSPRAKGFLEGAKAVRIPAEVLRYESLDLRARVAGGPAAFYAAGESIAAELLAACVRDGIRVPEDAAILSGDDFGTVCENAVVPLSAIDLAMEEKGYRAAELLARLMRGDRIPATTVVPPAGVFSRASTRLFRSGDSEIDRIVNHLRESCRRRVGLGELCAEIGVPLRTAQHLLKTKMGTTPGKLLREFRLNNAERMAAEGALKVDAVAQAVGYSGRSGLARARDAAKKR